LDAAATIDGAVAPRIAWSCDIYAEAVKVG
jgi:hypothetical protein